MAVEIGSGYILRKKKARKWITTTAITTPVGNHKTKQLYVYSKKVSHSDSTKKS